MKEIAPEIVTKSGIMLGLGETEPEIFQAMDDLREAGVQVLTMGQYLRPDSAASAGGGIRASGHVQFLRRDGAAEKASRTWPPGRWCAAVITRRISSPVKR